LTQTQTLTITNEITLRDHKYITLETQTKVPL